MTAATAVMLVALEKFSPVKLKGTPLIRKSMPPEVIEVQLLIACWATDSGAPISVPRVAARAQEPMYSCESWGFCPKAKLAAKYSGDVVEKSPATEVSPEYKRKRVTTSITPESPRISSEPKLRVAAATGVSDTCTLTTSEADSPRFTLLTM